MDKNTRDPIFTGNEKVLSEGLISHHVIGIEIGKGYKDKGKDNARTLRLAMTMSIISLIMTTAGLLITVLTLDMSYTDHKLITSDETSKPFACVACMKLMPDPAMDIAADPLIRTLARTVEDEVEMCCAHNTEQMSAMFQSVMRRSEPPAGPLPSYNVSDFKFSPVSAHKRIYQGSNYKMPEDFGEIKFPEKPDVCHFRNEDLPGLEHHREVEILEDGIRILHSGLYYVYSSVEFRPQSRLPCAGLASKTFTHSVMRAAKHRPSASHAILRTTHTCCDNCINTQNSRFTGGLFILDAGDIVRVNVIGYELVHFLPELSFLGLAMLGSVTG